MKNIALKPLLLPKEDYAACVHVDKGNQTILKVYKRTMKTTMTAALDLLIGLAARCFEEKDDQEIRDLQHRAPVATDCKSSAKMAPFQGLK